MDCGLSPTDITAITKGWAANMAALQSAMLAKNAYTWQSFYNPKGEDREGQPATRSVKFVACEVR